jgi:hypothetical protein
VTKSATSPPRIAVTANFGAGKNAGRFSTLPSSFENVLFVTGFGADALTGPSVSSTHRISPKAERQS